MADYIYLLENRLSAAQQRAIQIVRNLARASELTVFLTGGAVRDLTSGSAVRDLDLTVVGPVAPLRPQLEAEGAVFVGEEAAASALYFLFPGGVRVEVSSAASVAFPKPGKPIYTPAGITEDLRRRDFTANAMALSLNEGSYGLLMDPLNGVADIENRELRLISNYGFLEDPTRMVRAVRLGSRSGWHMEERTRQRYDNAKAEDLFGSASSFRIAYELEEIFHEEDPVRIMRALDAEGWLKFLSPLLSAARPNDAALADLREKQGQLLTQGVLADASTLAFPLLLGKIAAPDVASLKKSFARPGFARQVDSLEARTRELQTRFSGKDAAIPSAAWRMLHEAEPELVLAMLVNGKGAVQARFKTFLQDSPNARQRIPYATLQEMRITPDMPVYKELLDKLFFELMDGKLGTPEETKAYLEPFSPPAPPPPVNLRRARAKKEARPSRARAKKSTAVVTVAAQEEAAGVAAGLMEPGNLTGPDRGTEPTPVTVLEGKVAPLAVGESEPTEKKPAKSTKPVAVLPDAEAPAARNLQAKPAPMNQVDKAATAPHPPRLIASKAAPVVSASGAAAPSSSKTAKAAKSASAAPSKATAKGTSTKVVEPKSGSTKGASPAPSKGTADKASSTKTAPTKAAPAKKGSPKTTSATSAKGSGANTAPARKTSAAKPASTVAKVAAGKQAARKLPPAPSKKAAVKSAGSRTATARKGVPQSPTRAGKSPAKAPAKAVKAAGKSAGAKVSAKQTAPAAGKKAVKAAAKKSSVKTTAKAGKSAGRR